MNEIEISREIIESYFEKLTRVLERDVAIIGAGPAGLVCGYYLGKAGLRSVIFERSLAPGGGCWGGGMMFNEVVLSSESGEILDAFGISGRRKGDFIIVDSVELGATLAAETIRAGTPVMNLILCEDIALRDGRVAGVVITYTAIERAGFHIDPLTVSAPVVVDATGHEAAVAHLLADKHRLRLATSSGNVLGEGAMCAELGEKGVVENTREIYPSVFATGMAASAVFGSPRMGPIFGGMLLSGRKCAQLIIDKQLIARG